VRNACLARTDRQKLEFQLAQARADLIDTLDH